MAGFSFSGIHVEVGGNEPEWSLFKVYIAKVAVMSCGFKVLAASEAVTLEWGKPVVREAVRLKKEAFGDIMLSLGSSEAVTKYRQARSIEAASWGNFPAV